LWLKAGSSNGLNRNWVYGISNTMVEDIRIGHSVLTIDSSQSGSSQQSLVVQVIVQEQVEAQTS